MPILDAGHLLHVAEISRAPIVRLVLALFGAALIVACTERTRPQHAARRKYPVAQDIDGLISEEWELPVLSSNLFRSSLVKAGRCLARNGTTAWLPSSARPCSWQCASLETGMARTRDAFLFVDPFVVSDLSEDVGEGVERIVGAGEVAGEWFGFPFGMLGHDRHVLVFGVVFELGVEA
jgi:hypothetical protein